jgi:AraC-like DNA-binding protein
MPRPAPGHYPVPVAEVDAAADVEAFLQAVSALLEEGPGPGAVVPAAAAGSAEDRAILRARARLARGRSEALGDRLEQLARQHARFLDAHRQSPPRRSAVHHQAAGMLMAMFGLTAKQAGELLAMLSWQQDRSPEALAHQMVAECERGGDPADVLRGNGVRGRPHVPLVLRRAVAFIERHAHDDITSDDIASAAGVGRRRLQHAFREHCGTSPTRYLRQVRLARAHRQLLAADPTRGDTVGAIADAWRLTHHGRFAVEYRAAYGVGPAHTLHR